jgi:outer membrane beta-barrel protein
MKRLVLGLSFAVVVSLGGKSASAQTLAYQDPAPADPPAGAAPADKPASDDPNAGLAGAVTNQTAPADAGAVTRRGWNDIVVVPRKAFLKGGRLELFPFTGVSLNDVLIRHYAFGGDLNYYLTDVFAVGLQGQYFLKERTDRESLVGFQFNRVATLNRYKWSASLNFGYVPGYGKFTMFNRYIIHWDMFVSGGVGLIQTEIIPRVVGDASFSNNRITPNIGVGTHLFLSNWLTFNVAVRDYLFNDLLEPTDRQRNEKIEAVKLRAQSQFVHNVMLYAGVGLYLPSSFQYRTPR